MKIRWWPTQETATITSRVYKGYQVGGSCFAQIRALLSHCVASLAGSDKEHRGGVPHGECPCGPRSSRRATFHPGSALCHDTKKWRRQRSGSKWSTFRLIVALRFGGDLSYVCCPSRGVPVMMPHIGNSHSPLYSTKAADRCSICHDEGGILRATIQKILSIVAKRPIFLFGKSLGF